MSREMMEVFATTAVMFLFYLIGLLCVTIDIIRKGIRALIAWHDGDYAGARMLGVQTLIGLPLIIAVWIWGVPWYWQMICSHVLQMSH